MKAGKYAFWMAVSVFLLASAVTAQGALMDLYSFDDYQYSTSGSTKRAQRFTPTTSTPNFMLSTELFDSAAMGVRLQDNDVLGGAMKLYTWQGSWSSTSGNATALLASAPVSLTGPGLGTNAVSWITVLPPAALPATGSYMIELEVTSYTNSASGPGWSLVRSNSNDGGANNDAFNASDTVRTDREYQVRLNVIPEPAAALLLLCGLPALFRRRR